MDAAGDPRERPEDDGRLDGVHEVRSPAGGAVSRLTPATHRLRSSEEEPALPVLVRVLIQKLANLIPMDGARSRLYRASGVKIGSGVFIGEGVLFDKLHPEYIEIGDRAAIGARTIITAHQV